MQRSPWKKKKVMHYWGVRNFFRNVRVVQHTNNRIPRINRKKSLIVMSIDAEKTLDKILTRVIKTLRKLGIERNFVNIDGFI